MINKKANPKLTALKTSSSDTLESLKLKSKSKLNTLMDAKRSDDLYNFYYSEWSEAEEVVEEYLRITNYILWNN